MRFKGFDLNLLVTLQKLIETRSVTATARQLNLSQPAVSGALRYLRRQFKDDILMQTGNRMTPTPVAVRLAGPLAKVLTEADALLTSSHVFEPALVQRRFVIQCSDFAAMVVLAPALRVVTRLAPRVEVTVAPLGDEPRTMLERGLVDLLIMPADFLTEEHPSVMLLSDRYVVIGWKGNPVMAGPISGPTLDGSPRVAVQFGEARRPRSALSAHLSARRVRGTAILVPGYGLIPHFLVRTDRLAVVPLLLARLYARQYPLAIQELSSPFGFTESIQYNRARSHDSGLLWLIAQITAAGRRAQQSGVPAVTANRS